MLRLHWAPKAYEDLDEIQRFIQEDNPEAAAQVVLHIIDRAEQLRAFPESGPLLPVKRWPHDTMRSLVVGSHIVFYRADDVFVSVIRVLHAARDYMSILKAEAI